MTNGQSPIQCLLTLPPASARIFRSSEDAASKQWLAMADPLDRQLGSGGATAYALVEAWKQTGQGQTFRAWLRSGRKLVVHGGGGGRTIPAYAAEGRPLLPVPVFRWSWGQRLDQRLLDLQTPDLLRVLNHAPEGTAVMVASGDVLLGLPKQLPAFPSADVLGLGLWQTPENAKDFGVFFNPRLSPQQLAFFLQKPPLTQIRSLLTDYLFLIDIGWWLFSERAIDVLLERCGWDEARQDFVPQGLRAYSIYNDLGPALGTSPTVRDQAINELRCAVVPLANTEFYHFGASRQMLESATHLQNMELDAIKLGMMGAKRYPSQHLQNTRFEYALRLEENHSLWIENSHISKSWELANNHVLTGVPPNQWNLHLEPGVCLDFKPVGPEAFCVCAYGINDDFGGRAGDAVTRWFDRPVAEWFSARGITLAAAGIALDQPFENVPLFPLLSPAGLEPRFIEWLFAVKPGASPEYRQRWLAARRRALRDLLEETNLERLQQQRETFRLENLLVMITHYHHSVFFKLDLQTTARMFAKSGQEPPVIDFGKQSGLEPLQDVHDRMFRAALHRQRQQGDWEKIEGSAFERLREMLISDAQLEAVQPRPSLLEDQIVWARSPVRLDLAGGWTDTPPYCLEFGGQVVNVAVDLNGQPPIQVFAKLCKEPHLVLRSIDLGVQEIVTTFEGLDTYAQPGSVFGMPKAALALAGFLPRFCGGAGFSSLRAQLEAFGGGLELSMLCAVPKGSGLGTSSILAATLLATLSDLCGLEWGREVLFKRTMVMEQMMTTGGGWQDQAGAIYGGIKLISTSPGLSQQPNVNWLPGNLFGREYTTQRMLLYYTGLTRLAKNILQEIVRGIFLNSPTHLGNIRQIGLNAEVCCRALQRCSYEELGAAIHNSWRLNQQLDSGTNPPEVQKILEPIRDLLLGAKLLGAGGGGYLLMLPKDETAATQVQRILKKDPPNPRARFVQFSLSETGLQITRS